MEVDLRKPQNEFYRMRKSMRPAVAANAGKANGPLGVAIDLIVGGKP